MNCARIVCLCVALFFYCAVCVSCDSFKSRGIAPGDLAPDLKLHDLEGHAVDLASLKGKVVLLNFWATWCGPCMLEMPGLEKLHQRLSPKGFTVIGVAIDDERENLKQVKAEYGLSFPILDDAQGVSKKSYRITGVPESVVIDRSGKIVLFVDPEDNEPVTKISGPREWEGEFMRTQLEKLLAQ